MKTRFDANFTGIYGLVDGESVVALDIGLNEVQHTVEEITIDESGYGFIIDEEGMVIAHSDPKQLGSYYSEDPEMAGTINKVRDNP